VIPVVEQRSDRRVPIEMPIYGKPGTEELWRQVMDGLRERVRNLGWRRTRLLLGTSGDAWPSAATVDLFRKVAPDVQWRALTHGGGAPKWGLSDHERTQPNGMVVGYLEIARRLVNRRVKLPDHPVACNARDKVGSDPFTYRGLACVNTIATNYDGFCWKGLDYWTYTTPEGAKRNALNTYVHFGNMVGGTPRAIAAPGPHGAVATVQFEMLRQGTQECEAALAIRENLRTLYPPPETTYDVANVTLHGALFQAGSRKNGATPRFSARGLELKLADQDGRLLPDILPDAPTCNHGKHTGRIQALCGAGDPAYQAAATLGDDPWVAGGQGNWTVKLARKGDAYTGSFDGSYKGQEPKGAVTGVFTPKGLAAASGAPRVTNDLTRRCDAATEALSQAYASGSRCGDVQRLVARLYATATEVASAAAAQRRGSAPKQ
jgi:hypothetical protein